MRRPRPATVARVVAAAASGALLAISRPPLDLGPLACVALVPLFVAWRGRSWLGAAGLAFVAGVVYYGTLCAWIWYFGAIALVPFSAAVALYWAAAGALIGWLRAHRVANPWVTAAVWVCADALVARWPFGGFSWGEIGYAFHDLAPARAVASVGGVTLLTFLAVALNAFLADLVADRRTPANLLRAEAGIALIAVVVVAATVTRSQPPVVGALHVALVQGNDQNRDLSDAELRAHFLPIHHFDLARQITDPVDLIVFPESSMNALTETDATADLRTDPFILSNLVRIARLHHAWVLANATVDAPPDGHKASNLDVLFDPTGHIAGTYSKRHLVPFGESVPFRESLQHLVKALEQVPRDFQPGHTPGVFTVAGVRIGTLICFESAFGYQVRPLVRDGAQVIVVSTNNRSYRRSANSEQHVAISQMRAAETGRPVVQAAISGITAVIDADGVVHDRTSLFQPRVVQTTVEATGGETPYVRYGEWATWMSLAIAGLAAAVALVVVRQRRRASLDSEPEPENASVESKIDSSEVAPPADERESTTSP
ncbi:MAG: apolipoprotein N-acyltransferase [Actinomycetota bacterium]|nr:apolipoprotein N-acyltransferase [Actinomycetota bacterium]